MVLVLEDDFEFILVTFHWCRIVNRFVNDCTNLHFLPLFLLHRSSLEARVPLILLGLIISTLEIALANILRDVLVLMDVADVHQCNKVDFPYLLFLCAFFVLGLKDLSFILLGFPKHASLRDRSPESSEPHVTLDSLSSLTRTTFGVHTSFFPSSHLKVSRTPRVFRVLLEEFVSQRDETTRPCFHIQRCLR